MLDIDHGSYPYVTSFLSHHRRGLHRSGNQPPVHRRGVGRVQSLLHPGGRRAAGFRNVRRGGRRDPGQGPGVWGHHRPGPPDWMVRRGCRQVQLRRERVYRPGAYQVGHPGRVPNRESLHRLPGRWSGHIPVSSQHRPCWNAASLSTKSCRVGTSQPPAPPAWTQLPANAISYIGRLEELLGCPVKIVSTGPSRGETILREPVIH